VESAKSSVPESYDIEDPDYGTIWDHQKREGAYAEMRGVDDYLRKPFAMDKFLESVSRLCPLDAKEPA